MTDLNDKNDKVVTTIEQVKEEVVHQEQQPTTTAANITTESFTENSKTSSSDDKIVKNDDVDFSIVDALPPQLNKGAESEEASKPVEKDAKVIKEDKKEKNDKLPFSQLFRYA